MSTAAVTEAPAAVTLTGVSKTYGRGGTAVRALDQVTLTAAPGEFSCLIGASGCGKSTLLSLVAGLDKPTTGQINVGGKVLLSEPGVTTVLMVTQSFLSAHPAIVADLLKANIQAIDYIKADPSAAAAAANDQLAAYTGKPLKAKVLGPAFKEITFTVDPDAASLTEDARQAVSVGLLKPVDLTGIFDLGPLNTLLTAADQPAVGS